MTTETERELFNESREELNAHMAQSHGTVLLESELHDLWQVATRSSKKEIARLERLLAYAKDSNRLRIPIV